MCDGTMVGQVKFKIQNSWHNVQLPPEWYQSDDHEISEGKPKDPKPRRFLLRSRQYISFIANAQIQAEFHNLTMLCDEAIRRKKQKNDVQEINPRLHIPGHALVPLEQLRFLCSSSSPLQEISCLHAPLRVSHESVRPQSNNKDATDFSERPIAAGLISESYANETHKKVSARTCRRQRRSAAHLWCAWRVLDYKYGCTSGI